MKKCRIFIHLYSAFDVRFRFVMLSLLSRTLIASQTQSTRYIYVLFVAILYAFTTLSYSSSYTRNMHATYPIYILSQFATYPQCMTICGKWRKHTEYDRMHNECFESVLRIFYVRFANVLRNSSATKTLSCLKILGAERGPCADDCERVRMLPE